MLLSVLATHPWISILFWLALYASDYVLTIIGARLYREGGKNFVVFHGSYELNPYYQKDVDAVRWFSPRFIAAAAITSILLAVIWFVGVQVLKDENLFEVVLGAFILVEVAIHLRHVRNIFLFRMARTGKGIEGRLSYARWLTLRMSSVELGSFGVVYLFFSLLTGRWFFFGGAVTCLLGALNHWAAARRQGGSSRRAEIGSGGSAADENL